MPQSNVVGSYNFYEAWPCQVIAPQLSRELLRRGVSAEGAQQSLKGEPVSSLSDRHRLAQILRQELGLTTGEQTAAVLLLPAVQKVRTAAARMQAPSGLELTVLGAQQFFNGLPLTNPEDHQILAAALGGALKAKM